MAAKLANHRAALAAASNGDGATGDGPAAAARLPPVPEPLLLRDVIYLLQGIDGVHVRFATPPDTSGPRRPYRRGMIVTDDGATDRANLEVGIEFCLEGTGYSLPAPTRVMLHQLAELGWLYRKIERAVSESSAPGPQGKAGGATAPGRAIGMVEQSLHAALKLEMTEYYRLVAVLEGELEDNTGEVGAPGVEGLEGGLTLRRLMVWTEETKLRMRLMATLVEEAGGEQRSPMRSDICTELTIVPLPQRTTPAVPF